MDLCQFNYWSANEILFIYLLIIILSNSLIDKLIVFSVKKTYRSDSNTELHQNSVGFDRKNIHFAADRSTLTFDPGHLTEYPEIGLTFSTASRTLNH